VVLVEALVRTVVVEVPSKLAQDGHGVALVVDQEPVGALDADAAHEPFGVAVHPRRPGRDLDHLHALGGEHRIEGAGELRVPVPGSGTGTR
jgi:hypothetical protein